MKFDKSMIGSKVYAIPTGNNARNQEGKIFTFLIISVGRVYVTLIMVYDDGSLGFESKYCPESGATQKAVNSGFAGNAGYKFFKSFCEIDEYKMLVELQKNLNDRLRWFDAKSLNKSQVQRIIDILQEGNE